MIISIKINVDSIASGYKSDDDLKDQIVDFAHDLIINGAEEMGVELTVKEVEY